MNAESGATFPLYRLIEDEAQRVVLTALDMEGFFVKPNQLSDYVYMLGASFRKLTEPMRLHDVEIQVLDGREEVIGAYYVGEAEVLSRAGGDLGDRINLKVSFSGYSCPYPRAGDIWRRWALSAPQVIGEWRGLPPDWHQSWLHVVQAAWFQAGRSASRYGSSKSYVVDGRGIVNAAGLYCEIGEAINGPGGYFGSGLDALADCLRSAVDIGQFELVWHNYGHLEESLDKSELHSVLTVFREFGVSVLFDACS